MSSPTPQKSRDAGAAAAAAPARSMRLRVSLPDRIVVDEETTKVVAEAQNGHFGLLPRHIDFVAGLVPGIFSYWPLDGRERYLAIDEGTLVKVEQLVLVSVRSAIPGDDLETLQQTVQAQFVDLDEHRRAARSALARLEAGVLRRLIELREEG